MNDSNFKNMIRKITFILAFFALTAGVSAQQEAHYTQFMYNQLYFNPAYAGARGMPSFTLLYRNQWIGFNGSPTSGLLSFNTPLLGDRIGFGLTLNTQSTGIFNTWNAAMAYSYNINLKRKQALLESNLPAIRLISVTAINLQKFIEVRRSYSGGDLQLSLQLTSSR